MNSTNSYQCYSVDSCRAAVFDPRYERYLFDFENNIQECDWAEWLTRMWKIVCFPGIAIYLVAIFTGQHLMKSRKPFQLRGALFVWNVSLAVFSTFSAWRTLTAMHYQMSLVGFHELLCGNTRGIFSVQYQKSIGLYLTMFGFSKIVELFDTAFIVLRKTPLIILHWFHHATVFFFTWSYGAYPSDIHFAFMTINFSVHSIMYSYYALKMLGIRVPKVISMAITSLQLLQMLAGLSITLYTYYMRASPDIGCCVVDEANIIALSTYFAYTVLFGNFFIRAYLSERSSKSVSDAKKSR